MIPRLALALLLSTCLFPKLNAQQIADRNPAYQIQRSDVLEVHYRYTPEFNQTVTVGPDGRVALPGLGTFVATGLTVEGFREKVVEVSSARLVKPEVSVILKEFEKPHVFVEGEVNTPGRFDIRSDISALDAIALAGGFKNSGKQNEVLLLRRIDATHEETRVLNLKRLISDHKLEEATLLRSGDVLYVPQNRLSKIERITHLGTFGAVYDPIP